MMTIIVLRSTCLTPFEDPRHCTSSVIIDQLKMLMMVAYHEASEVSSVICDDEEGAGSAGVDLMRNPRIRLER